MQYPNQGDPSGFFDPQQMPSVMLHRFGAVRLVGTGMKSPTMLAPFWRLYLNSEVMLIESGDGEAHELAAERVYLIPPWWDHYRRDVRLMDHIYAHVSTPWLLRSFVLDVWPGPVIPADMSRAKNQLRRLADDVLAAGHLDTARQLAVTSIFEQALAELIVRLPDEHRQRLERTTGLSDQLRAVLDHIEANIDQPLTADDLADVAACSPTHLRRLFREELHESPNQYVTDRRIAHAAELLFSTEISIDRIAAACGYSQRFYFSRVFKKIMGQPPAAFRAHHRKA